MSKLVDLTGQRFGRLTVMERAEDHIQPSGKRVIMWRCRCDCGKEHVVLGWSLKSGHIRSCGCLNTELRRKRKITHGGTGTRLFGIWLNIRDRCLNPKNNRYKHYGGRGIAICQDWQCDFAVFRDWAISNGYRDDLSIDRIDVNGDYCPENCRWATAKEQSRNKRNNRILTVCGEKMIAKDCCEKFCVPRSTLFNRLKVGYTTEEALGIVPREKD